MLHMMAEAMPWARSSWCGQQWHQMSHSEETHSWWGVAQLVRGCYCSRRHPATPPFPQKFYLYKAFFVGRLHSHIREFLSTEYLPGSRPWASHRGTAAGGGTERENVTFIFQGILTPLRKTDEEIDEDNKLQGWRLGLGGRGNLWELYQGSQWYGRPMGLAPGWSS